MAHHGIGRNPRLTRLMKKRSRVAAHSTPIIAHHPIPTGSGFDCGSNHDTKHSAGQESVPVFDKRQDRASSEDLAKVWATVVNVIDDESYTSTQSAEMTFASSHAWFDGSVTAFPGYTSLTADTPSLTGSSQSITSAASSAYSSTMTSRPLINSSQPTPSSTSLTPTSSLSASDLSDSLSSTTTSASLVTRSSTKTSSLSTSSSTSSLSSSFSSSTSTSTSTSTTSSDSSGYSGWVGGGYGGGGGSTQTGSGQDPTPTDTNSNQNSSSAPGPATTGKIVGGVVGSVAGAVMLVILALFFLKRRASMRKTQQALPSAEEAGAGAGGNMTGMESRPDSLLTATYFAPAFMKRWRQSTMTTNTDSTLVSNGSERGFQKISGRKIPSVLTHGGDGFGGGYDTGSPTLSEPSMTTAVPGSPVNPRSPLTQPPPSTPFGMPLDVSYTREAEENDSIMYMRASPARTPVTSTASMSSVSAPINIPRQSHSSLSPIPQRPDMLGRSHPSFDGSRGSRFTESL